MSTAGRASSDLNYPTPITDMAMDDRPVFLQRILSLLRFDPGMRLVATACTGVQAIQRHPRIAPDVALMDGPMRSMDGRAATETVVGEFPGARNIWLTMYEGSYIVTRAVGRNLYERLLADNLTAATTWPSPRRHGRRLFSNDVP
jgi:DNA-binding NarL/FixJ family response regulator